MSIQTIIAETSISGLVRRNGLWDVINNIELHSQELANVLDLYLIKNLEGEKHLSWNAMLDDAPFSWVEKNISYPDKMQVKFELLNGDFDVWKGKWSVGLNREGKVSLKVKLDYELGIPVLEENISDILQEKIYGYLNNILGSISKLAGGKQSNERTVPRYILENFNNAYIGDPNLKISILDISKFGAKIKLNQPLEKFNESVSIGKHKFEIGEIKSEVNENFRIVFAHPAPDNILSSILNNAQFIKVNS